jgi:hypothetical protein
VAVGEVSKIRTGAARGARGAILHRAPLGLMRATAGGRPLEARGRLGPERAEMPRRCILPITALRETPPSRRATWLALNPSRHICVSSATRKSFQSMALRFPVFEC